MTNVTSLVEYSLMLGDKQKLFVLLSDVAVFKDQALQKDYATNVRG